MCPIINKQSNRYHTTKFYERTNIIGSIIGDLSREGKSFEDNEEYCVNQLKSQGISASLEDILKYTNPKNIVESYNCYGGTGINSVKKMIKNISEDNDKLKKYIYPRGVFVLKYGDNLLNDKFISSIISFNRFISGLILIFPFFYLYLYHLQYHLRNLYLVY